MWEPCKHRVQRGDRPSRIERCVLVHAGRCAAVGPYITPLLPRHLENDFQLDRGAERQACDPIHQAARVLV